MIASAITQGQSIYFFTGALGLRWQFSFMYFTQAYDFVITLFVELRWQALIIVFLLYEDIHHSNAAQSMTQSFWLSYNI